MLKALLQGKPFGHPLHPAVVHFPIGLFVFSLVLDAASQIWASNFLVRGAYYTILGGVLMGLLAALFGLADWSDIRRDHPSRKTANTHMLLNITGVILFAASLFFRRELLEQESASMVLLAISLLGVGVISYSGYLGGMMVYDDGIGAGRHRRQTPTPRETIRVSSEDAQEGWVSICPFNELEDGETLRVECDGVVMAVARRGDAVYAFQEFCTHRYGPLSEGAFYEHQVECPWHRSCFDIRTGQVTEGPAKVDLKIFPAEVRAGEISLKVR